jgi:dolichol-phosphate mannosyltransferase
MKGAQEKISFVFPVFNEESNLQELYRRVRQACGEAGVGAYEMVFVDNGSTDNSLAVIKELRRLDESVRYVSLSRNFGHQNALFAGMCHANGDATITMDADLQHPPSLIPKMIECWRKGAEVVYTMKNDHQLAPQKYFLVKLFYWVISKVSAVQLSFGQSDFRLLDRKVLSVIVEIPEYHKFLRGQVKWIGFRQEGLSYDVEKRLSGEPKFTYRNLFSFALDGILAFSRYPLHIIMLLGMVISTISLLYLTFAFVVAVLHVLNISRLLPLPPGWLSLIVSVSLLGSMQLIAVGILGEYIGRIYDQTKGRPVFIIREKS